MVRLAIPSASRARRVLWRGEELRQALRETLDEEFAERRGFLWLPVLFGIGILVYFALPGEPLLAALLGATFLAGLTAWRAWTRGTAFLLLTAMAVVLAGATTAKLRVLSVEAPRIERPITAEIEGRVRSVELRAERAPRLVLDRLSIGRLPAEATPERIRVTMRGDLPRPGDAIMLTARLMPPPGPDLPGGFDARRGAFFDRIGATGFALGAWRPAGGRRSADPLVWIATAREAITARILRAAPGEAGAVAAALLVGERGPISEETNQDLRDSGLAHILSISGVHMALVAGSAYAAVRVLLALMPRLALLWPIHKWAALVALLVATFYLAISGGNVATLRSYVMTAIMFAALLVDRPALAMRNIALSALVVLAMEPESVAEPGFLMSFAAVTALIAAWEAWRERPRSRLEDRPQRLPGIALSGGARWLGGVALTTLVASAATAPFAVYFFQRIANYALLGNLLAMPLVSTLIMPFGLLALVLMPLGLEHLPLAIMAFGIDLLLDIASWVASLKGASVATPPLSTTGLLLMTAGLLWLCLWRLSWRLLGLLPIAAGIALAAFAGDRPDILVSADGRVVAVRDAKGVLRVSGGRAGSFTLEQWFAGEGAVEANELREGVRCDLDACLLQAGNGATVAHIRGPAAFLEECRWADIVVTALQAPRNCAAALVIDADDLSRGGAHAIRLMPGDDDDRSGRRSGLVASINTAQPARPRLWWGVDAAGAASSQ